MSKAKTTNLEPLLVSGDVAASMLSIGHALFFKMRSDGRLGPMPISFGRKRLYDISELRDWVAAKCPNREVWQQRVKEEQQDES